MKYILISGYFEKHAGMAWFHKIWRDTIQHHANPSPERIFIIASGNCSVAEPRGEWIRFSGDLGHCDDLLSGRKPFFMPGCPATWMAGAWLAYMNECDAIFYEQDVLAFGPWVERMYHDLGDKDVIFGRNQMQGAATSLFLVRHRYIPQFVMDYLSEGPETVISRIPETKFNRMEARKPEHYCRYSFSYDKDRPFKPTDDVFFVQKLKPFELLWLEANGLVSCADMPQGVEAFSNTIP